jgi:hypothetical protein
MVIKCRPPLFNTSEKHLDVYKSLLIDIGQMGIQQHKGAGARRLLMVQTIDDNYSE